MTPNCPGEIEKTRMYCGPSGMMIMKSTIVVKWIAASESSSHRSANGSRRAPPDVLLLLKIKLACEGFTPYCSSHKFGKPHDPWPPATKIRNNLCALELSSKPQLP